jgi:exosortase B
MPSGVDPVVFLLVFSGLAALYLPTLWDLVRGSWSGHTQGHELLILLVSAWLFFLRRERLRNLDSSPMPRIGGALLVFGLFLYLFGRAVEVVRLELASLIVVLAATLIWFRGLAALRAAWFPLFFLLFAIPLPHEVVLALTGPLKDTVSVVAADLLYLLGYPVGRSGVVITIGQYQLLVVEACAGLQTMFTLEAMGLLYASLVQHTSTWRNILLAALVVPIAFAANVVRVMALALITYYFGNAAGQGFLHGFAGILLFAVALALIIAVDGLVGRVLGKWEAA